MLQSVARSTSTDELLAAADTDEILTHIKYSLEEKVDKQTTELFQDFRSTFRLCSTSKESEEVRSKTNLASNRQELNQILMDCIRLTSAQSHLAYTLTMENAVIGRQRNEVLQSCRRKYLESLYTVFSDILAPYTLSLKVCELSTCKACQDIGVLGKCI